MNRRASGSIRPSNVVSEQLDEAEAEAVEEFWTEDLIAEALENERSRELPPSEDLPTDWAPVDGPAGAVAPDAPEVTSERSGSDEVRTSALPLPVPPHPTIGKVLFTDARTGYPDACTGAIVNSANGSTMVTDGHCVHGGAGSTWHRNWAFAPGFAP